VHEPVLLETGGGIKNAQPWLRTKPFIAYSGDVLTDLALEPLLEAHFRSGNDVTLALRETGLASNVAFREGRIVDIGNRYGHAGNFDYANVSVWNPQIFERIPSGKKISFIPVLAEWIGAGGRIGGVVSQEGRWWNLGSPAEYLAVHRTLNEESWRPDYVQPSAWPIRIAPDATVDPSAQVRGCTSIGAGCRIGAGAIIEDSILWPGAQIASHSRLKNCIVRAHRSAQGTLSDAVI
jgi:NDP-sugar pyrophosphorylase family protein